MNLCTLIHEKFDILVNFKFQQFHITVTPRYNGSMRNCNLLLILDISNFRLFMLVSFYFYIGKKPMVEIC